MTQDDTWVLMNIDPRTRQMPLGAITVFIEHEINTLAVSESPNVKCGHVARYLDEFVDVSGEVGIVLDVKLAEFYASKSWFVALILLNDSIHWMTLYPRETWVKVGQK